MLKNCLLLLKWPILDVLPLGVNLDFLLKKFCSIDYWEKFLVIKTLEL